MAGATDPDCHPLPVLGRPEQCPAPQRTVSMSIRQAQCICLCPSASTASLEAGECTSAPKARVSDQVSPHLAPIAWPQVRPRSHCAHNTSSVLHIGPATPRMEELSRPLLCM